MTISKAITGRFLAKVDIRGPNECWNWKNGCFDFGHGEFWMHGRGNKAHRVMWQIVYGGIPTGKCILHSCDNPPCCNPRHLFAGTQLDNVVDMVRKKRGAKGESQGASKLTSKQVEEIRKERKSIGTSFKGIAEKFGVSKACVMSIIKRKTWKHI